MVDIIKTTKIGILSVVFSVVLMPVIYITDEIVDELVETRIKDFKKRGILKKDIVYINSSSIPCSQNTPTFIASSLLDKKTPKFNLTNEEMEKRYGLLKQSENDTTIYKYLNIPKKY